MDYLNRQFLLLQASIKEGTKLENVLPIKFYIQSLMCDCIAELLPTGSSVLEVGCGGSLTIHMLSLLGFDCYAIDNSRMSLEFSELLRNYFHSGVKILRADAFSLPFHAAHFKYVYSVGLIEHYIQSEQELLVKEMSRCSSKYVHIEVPNYAPTSSFYHIFTKEPEGHYAYNLSSLMRLVKADIIKYDGRGVFTVSERLEKNPKHKAFVVNVGPTTNRESFEAKDIQTLCQLEAGLSNEERLHYGYQIYAIGEKQHK